MSKLLFLGTGTSNGVPVIGCSCEVCLSEDRKDKRARTSAYVTNDTGTKILIDVGPDFHTQALTYKIGWIDGILITHSHQDHIGGIDELRQYNFIMRKKIDLFGTQLSLNEIENRFDYIFKDTQVGGGKPQLDLHLADQPFTLKDQTVIPIPILHGEIPIYGYRMDGLAYLTDASRIPGTSYELLKDLKVLVVNALRFEPHPTHFNLEQALALIDRVKPERAYLIHLTHLFKHERDSKLLPKGVEFAFDGLEIEY